MASRRGFFGYDPYDYHYTTSPYGYSYPYYHRPAANAFFPDAEPAVRETVRPSPYYPYPASARRAPARNDGAFFPEVEVTEPAVKETVRPRPGGSSRSSVSVPVQFVGSDPKEEIPKKRMPSAEEAAVRVQAAARGLLARRMVREVRAVERQAEAVAARVAAQAEELRGDARARIGVGEELMRLLLHLDGVRGAREYRRRVTKRVLALQDAVDALEAKPAQAAADSLPAAETVDMSEARAEEESGGMAPELMQATEIEANTAADTLLAAETTDTAMEVDGAIPMVDEAGQAETELVAEGKKAAEAEGEWEMVAAGDDDVSAGEEDPAPPKAQQQQQEPAGEEKKTVAAAADGLNARKVMEMVAALCERSAQQCALIGALAERVDTLERAVRRVEDADRRRRRNKKINKEGKKAARSFYSD